MTTITQIIQYVEETSGSPLFRDEGVDLGPTDRPIQNATVCWMATPDAIRYAGERNHDLIIGHESLFYPYDVVNQIDQPEGWQDWPVNRQRRDLLEKHNLTFMRLHGSVDDICILTDFADQLQLGPAVHDTGRVRVYEIDPCSFDQLVERTKQATNMNAVRVAPVDPMPEKIRRIGLPWGGMGLFVNVGYMQDLIEAGCDAFIAGETDNYGFRFPQEVGIPIIETSHELSENRGLRNFTDLLNDKFPATDFHFYENPCVWEMR